MADDDHGTRIVGQMVFEPERAFEIEIVGRLVEQQQIRGGKQRGRKRDAHPPAAGKFRTGFRLVGSGKTETVEDCGGAGRRGMRLDIHQPGLDVGDAGWIVRRVRFAQQRFTFEIGLQHHLDEAFRTVGGLLGETADAPAWGQGDGSGFGRQFAPDRPKQRRLADAVAADKADPGARYDLG